MRCRGSAPSWPDASSLTARRTARSSQWIELQDVSGIGPSKYKQLAPVGLRVIADERTHDLRLVPSAAAAWVGAAAGLWWAPHHVALADRPGNRGNSRVCRTMDVQPDSRLGPSRRLRLDIHRAAHTAVAAIPRAIARATCAAPTKARQLRRPKPRPRREPVADRVSARPRSHGDQRRQLFVLRRPDARHVLKLDPPT